MYLLWGFLLEKLRAGGDERIHKPGAVFPCPAPRLFNAALNEMVVAFRPLDDVKIVLAPAGVNVGIRGGLPAVLPGCPYASQIAKLRAVP